MARDLSADTSSDDTHPSDRYKPSSGGGDESKGGTKPSNANPSMLSRFTGWAKLSHEPDNADNSGEEEAAPETPKPRRSDRNRQRDETSQVKIPAEKKPKPTKKPEPATTRRTHQHSVSDPDDSNDGEEAGVAAPETAKPRSRSDRNRQQGETSQVKIPAEKKPKPTKKPEPATTRRTHQHSVSDPDDNNDGEEAGVAAPETAKPRSRSDRNRQQGETSQVKIPAEKKPKPTKKPEPATTRRTHQHSVSDPDDNNDGEEAGVAAPETAKPPSRLGTTTPGGKTTEVKKSGKKPLKKTRFDDSEMDQDPIRRRSSMNKQPQKRKPTLPEGSSLAGSDLSAENTDILARIETAGGSRVSYAMKPHGEKRCSIKAASSLSKSFKVELAKDAENIVAVGDINLAFTPEDKEYAIIEVTWLAWKLGNANNYHHVLMCADLKAEKDSRTHETRLGFRSDWEHHWGKGRVQSAISLYCFLNDLEEPRRPGPRRKINRITDNEILKGVIRKTQRKTSQTG